MKSIESIQLEMILETEDSKWEPVLNINDGELLIKMNGKKPEQIHDVRDGGNYFKVSTTGIIEEMQRWCDKLNEAQNRNNE